MSINTKSTTTKRYRSWSIVSNALSYQHISEFIQSHPTIKAIGGVHDRDPGTEAHGHLFFQDKRTPRTAASVQRFFSVPVVIKPFIVHPQADGPVSGKFGMARAGRYLTHEHPEQQALGKARYGDDEVIASPGWDWRSDVDALNCYEGVDPEKPAKTTLIERLSDRVLAGELTARDIYRNYPRVALAKGLSYWDGLEKRADSWAHDDRKAALRTQHQAELDAWEAGRSERLRRVAEKAEQERVAAVAREQRLTAERAEQEKVATVEREQRLAAKKAEQESPEYQARVRAEATEAERLDLVDMIGIWRDAEGVRSVRSQAAVEAAREIGLTGEQYIVNGALTHLGAVLVLAEQTMDTAPDEVALNDLMPKIREAIAEHHREILSVTRSLAAPEFHAADGQQVGFDLAFKIRRQWRGYSDLVRLPPPRTDIKPAWRKALLDISQPALLAS